MVAAPSGLIVNQGERPIRSQWRVLLERLRHRHHFVVGMSFILLMVFLALFAPLLTAADPVAVNIDDQFLPPSPRYPFGTDDLGRDVLARVLYGGRESLRVGFLATMVALVAGAGVGALAGYRGGWFDLISQRLLEVLMAFPGLLLALAIIAILGPGLENVLLALAVGGIPFYARLTRAQVLSMRESEYVEAARVAGAGDTRVMFRHILPNSLSSLIVAGTLDLGANILAGTGLSFIGLGAQPPSPEWGAMLSVGRDFMREQWWIGTFPGLAIVVAVLGFNLLGDGLRDVFDPRMTAR